MRITEIEIGRRAQAGGWVCKIWFDLTTAKQFSDERHMVEEFGRYWWSSLWNTWRAAKKSESLFKAKPGERSSNGWAE
jgi:hypothetical protein